MKLAFRKWLAVVWAGGIGGAVALLLFLAWLADEALEGDTLRFDNWASTHLQRHAAETLTTVMVAITTMGSTVVLIGLIVITVLYLLWVGRRRGSLVLAVTMAGAFLLNIILKLSFHRQRPEPLFGLASPPSFSFPSGHALLSFCFYGVVALLITTRVRNQAARLAIWAVAALLVLLIGISRIYLGMHYASDVIAGYTAALIWLLTVGFVYDKRRRGRRTR